MTPSGVKSDRGKNVTSDIQQSFYELTKHLAGSVDGPSELSHNKKHTQGLVQTKDDIWSALRKNQNRIREFGVRKLGLFGSFVREEQRLDSDVDLLVEFEQDKKTFKNFMALAFLLEEILNHQVELVTTESLSLYIRPYVAKEVEYVTFAS
jgi:predicted nucleotidyltransferase